jgi:hypothetical protein
LECLVPILIRVLGEVRAKVVRYGKQSEKQYEDNRWDLDSECPSPSKMITEEPTKGSTTRRAKAVEDVDVGLVDTPMFNLD